MPNVELFVKIKTTLWFPDLWSNLFYKLVEVYLGPCQKFTMDLFYEKIERLLVINYFSEKAQ